MYVHRYLSMLSQFAAHATLLAARGLAISDAVHVVPCTGCLSCHMHADGVCVHQDALTAINAHIKPLVPRIFMDCIREYLDVRVQKDIERTARRRSDHGAARRSPL